jgi:sulfur transfer protein SufE
VLRFQGDSDAHIVRGLSSMVGISGKAAERFFANIA